MRKRAACRRILDLLLPFGPCGLCGADSRGGPAPGICRSCWRARRRPAEPACPSCGVPLPAVEGQEAHLCGECLGDPPAYEAHVSAFVYEGPVRHLVLLFKERLRYPLAKLLGRALAKRARSAWPQERWDAVVYVPSPTRRRLRRGFEPAGLIALEASRVLGIQCRRWIRVRRSPAPQKGLTSAGRRRNLQGVFAADKARVRGLRLLLVDDVRTTGATLREAARVLKRAGATVHTATFAMVLARPLDLMRGAEGDGPSADVEWRG